MAFSSSGTEAHACAALCRGPWEGGLWGAPQRRFAAFAASPLVHTRGAGEARGLVPLAPERWYSPLGVRWKEARSEPLSSTSDESEEEDPSK